MPDKLSDLSKELDRLRLGQESKDVGNLKIKLTPIELAIMSGNLNRDLWLSDDEEENGDEN